MNETEQAARIARLEKVLGTLIAWLHGQPLSSYDTRGLLEMLHPEEDRE